MSAKEFYELSGKDFKIDENSENLKEQEFYKTHSAANKDGDTAITYDEYLKNLHESGTMPSITQLDIEQAELLKNVSDPLFHDNGKLDYATLSKDQEIQGIKCKGEESVTFYENGKLWDATLSADQEIQGIKFKARENVNFHKNGKLRLVILPTDQEIQGIKCKGEESVQFHENGKLDKATLSADQEIQGIKFKAGEVTFHENGKLDKATLSADQEIQGIKFKAGEAVSFHKNGKIRFAFLYLSADQEIQGVNCKGGNYPVCFHENGKLKKVTLSVDQEIQGVKFKAEDVIYFSEDGKLTKDNPSSELLAK